MFERMTERARQLVVLAQEEARNLKHDWIGTEHVLLGILREEEGVGARVLASLDITIEKAREQVVAIAPEGGEATSRQIPFTPRAKTVLELALREALSLGHNYIGTEHILLGLVRENGGDGVRILHHFNADPEQVRREVIRILQGPRRAQAPDPPKRSDWGEDPTAQDVIDALRVSMLAQKDHAEIAKIVGCLLEFAPETDSSRGIDLLLRLISEATLKVALVGSAA